VAEPRPPTADARVLEARGVWHAFDGRRVLEDVSATVRPGRVLGLIGPNGAGKSTLLRTLAGVLHPDRGVVHLDGHALGTRGRRAVARDLALVLQDEEIPFPFTVRELVTLGRYPHAPAGLFWPADDRAIVHDVLTRLDLLDLAERPVDRLSGGERKRVLLARALAQQPAYLLLDEPTAALDLKHQLSLLEAISDLRDHHGVGVAIVLHDLNLVAQFCDQVLLLHKGRARSHGSPEEVLVYPVLKEVFGVEIYIGVNELTGTLHLHPMRPRAEGGGRP